MIFYIGSSKFILMLAVLPAIAWCMVIPTTSADKNPTTPETERHANDESKEELYASVLTQEQAEEYPMQEDTVAAALLLLGQSSRKYKKHRESREITSLLNLATLD